MEEKKLPEQKVAKARFEVVQVPTEFGLGFKDNTTEEVIDSNQLLLRLANDIQEIKKAVI
jgi:hypothetical protein